MKKYLLITLAIVLMALPMAARRTPGEKVGVRFDTLTYDFGTVKSDAGPVTHVFTYTVDGDVAVGITNATARCGCTTPKYDRKPVTPGGKGEISVQFLPEGQAGEIEKDIRVNFRNGANKSELVTLRLVGVVVPVKK